VKILKIPTQRDIMTKVIRIQKKSLMKMKREEIHGILTPLVPLIVMMIVMKKQGISDSSKYLFLNSLLIVTNHQHKKN